MHRRTREVVVIGDEQHAAGALNDQLENPLDVPSCRATIAGRDSPLGSRVESSPGARMMVMLAGAVRWRANHPA